MGRSARPIRRGQSLAELCFSMPLLFVILFTIIEFGFTFYQTLRIQDAVREGGRAGAQRRTDAQVRTLVRECVPGLTLPDNRIDVDAYDSAGNAMAANARTTGARLVVAIRYDLAWLTPLGSLVFSNATRTLYAKATFRVEAP